MFCARSCASANNNKQSPRQGNRANLNPGNRLDELSPFRETLKRCRSRDKEVSIDLDYLKEVWELQKGLCPYLKVPLVLPTTSKSHDTSNPNRIASLDRIDSNLGYVPGNVQFISMTLNYAKNKFDDEVINDLFKTIRGLA